MKKTHLIIGTSAAALGVLSKLRTLDPESNIICISDEQELPYNKCFLADYVSGSKDSGAVHTKPRSFFEQNRIELLLARRVVSLDAQQKKVTLSDGQTITYETLFLGTGSSPIVPLSLQTSQNISGVFTFHTLADSTKLLNYVQQNNVTNVAVIGTGLSGLECADALAARGLHVNLIGRGQLLRRFIDERASLLIEQMMTERGINFLKQNELDQVLVNEQNAVCGARLKNGQQIAAQMVIVATGLRPNNELALQASLQLHNEYVAVDEQMRTSDQSIWAGGDCCVVRDQLTGELVPSTTWPDAMMQGMIAAHGMCGISKKYPGIQSVISSSFFGTQFVAAGIVLNVAEHDEIVVRASDDFYHKFVVRDGRLVGFLLVGHVNQAPRLKRALMTREMLSGGLLA